MFRSSILFPVLAGALAAPVFAADSKAPQTPSSAAAGVDAGRPQPTRLKFNLADPSCGIDFQHKPHRSTERYMPEIMGSGAAVVDVNRDGAPDVICINSGNLLATDRPADARNRLYINDGRGRFRDRTDEWKLPSPGYGMGVAAGDFDNDGWIDLYLTTWGGHDALLRNTGRDFVDVTAASKINPGDGWASSAGFFDMDGDGDLDLYVVRYVDYTVKNALKCYSNNYHIYCTPVLYDSLPDRLLRNNGNGTFTDVSAENDFNKDPAKGLALVIYDINTDGNDDVFVANDTSRNLLHINDGKGRFREIGREAGVAYSEIGAEEAGMGADVTSLANDGRMDIACTHFQGETTAIYRSGKGLFFREVADRVGVGVTSRARLKFGVDYFDADNDGDEDLLIANGHIIDLIAKYREDITFEQPNSLYENLGDGNVRDVSAAAGPGVATPNVGRGLATGDLDGDGRIDFVINNNGGPIVVGMNATPAVGHWVNLWLEGRKSNRTGIGAQVDAVIGDRKIHRQVCGASSYLSICDFKLHLGLGDAKKIDQLTIRWTGGKTQVIKGLEADKFYHVVEGDEPKPFVPGARSINP